MAGRSEFFSDAGEDTSTIGGDAVSGIVAPDAASTRAVLSARGVIGVLNGGDNTRASTDTSSLHLHPSNGDTLATDKNDLGSSTHRPEMPDREEFKTASEELQT
jgi:hypothetical protein